MRADDPFLMNITHDQLVDYIKENTLTILGEEIHLHAGAIQGTWDALFPDLMGTDAQGRTVIVEVQTDLDEGSTGIPPTIHKSIGQLIHYASDYDEPENLRLFIVSPAVRPQMQHICQYLRSHGINLRHVSIHQDLLIVDR